VLGSDVEGPADVVEDTVDDRDEGNDGETVGSWRMSVR
jgi:hypothetical protein